MVLNLETDQLLKSNCSIPVDILQELSTTSSLHEVIFEHANREEPTPSIHNSSISLTESFRRHVGNLSASEAHLVQLWKNMDALDGAECESLSLDAKIRFNFSSPVSTNSGIFAIFKERTAFRFRI